MITETHIQNSKSLTKLQYDVLHTWIKRKHGKATTCEHPECEGKSKFYDWALIKGKSYERNINNFWQLCRSCHLKYDCSAETRQKVGRRMREFWRKPENKKRLSDFRKTFKYSEEAKRKMSIRMAGEKNHMHGVRLHGSENPMYGKKHSDATKKLLHEKRAFLNNEQVRVIRAAVKFGCKQSDLADTFGISRGSMCRIVNNKRYTLC